MAIEVLHDISVRIHDRQHVLRVNFISLINRSRGNESLSLELVRVGEVASQRLLVIRLIGNIRQIKTRGLSRYDKRELLLADLARTWTTRVHSSVSVILIMLSRALDGYSSFYGDNAAFNTSSQLFIAFVISLQSAIGRAEKLQSSYNVKKAPSGFGRRAPHTPSGHCRPKKATLSTARVDL